jgi:hypothetical protein
VLLEVLRRCSAETLSDNCNPEVLAEAQTVARVLDTDTIIEAFDAVNDIQKRSVVNHIAATFLSATDERKRYVSNWLGYSAEDGAMHPDSSAQALAAYTREVLKLDDERINVQTATLDEVLQQIRLRPEPLMEVLQAMVRSYGAAYLLGQAVQAAMEQCEGVQS